MFIPELQQLRLIQDAAGSQELNPCLPCGQQGAKYCSHHSLPPRVCISRKLELEVELEWERRYCDMGCACPKQCLSYHCIQHLPPPPHSLLRRGDKEGISLGFRYSV